MKTRRPRIGRGRRETRLECVPELPRFRVDHGEEVAAWLLVAPAMHEAKLELSLDERACAEPQIAVELVLECEDLVAIESVARKVVRYRLANLSHGCHNRFLSLSATDLLWAVSHVDDEGRGRAQEQYEREHGVSLSLLCFHAYVKARRPRLEGRDGSAELT